MPKEVTRRERSEMDARARSKGGKKKKGRSNLKVDSYLPVKPYSEERYRPWDV